MSRRRTSLPSLLPTNSPRVHDQTVEYARVMGERVNMNREGLTDTVRTDAAPVQYQDMRRPDYREPVRPPRDRQAWVDLLTKPHPDIESPPLVPIPPPPRRKPGPLRFGTADAPRTGPARQAQVVVRPDPVAWVRSPVLFWCNEFDTSVTTAYVLEVDYAEGGMGRFEFTAKERARAERFAARETAIGSVVRMYSREAI